MYNPLRYIDPSGWAMKPSNSRPDDPPGLGHYRPGIYNPTDSEFAWHVRLPDAYVFASSPGFEANSSNTNYTEGTKWNNNEQYTYLGTTHNTGPTLGSGGGGGGIGMGPNNQWGNSQLTPSVVSCVTATGKELYYSKKYGTWMGKNFKIYKQKWGGNGTTGGKLKFAKKVSNTFKGVGWTLGAHNAYKIYNDFSEGNISLTTMCIEEMSNAISTLGGLGGAAWGIGWELGRCVTNMEWHQEMKFNMIYNQVERQIGPPSPTNEHLWNDFFENYNK